MSTLDVNLQEGDVLGTGHAGQGTHQRDPSRASEVVARQIQVCKRTLITRKQSVSTREPQGIASYATQHLCERLHVAKGVLAEVQPHESS